MGLYVGKIVSRVGRKLTLGSFSCDSVVAEQFPNVLYERIHVSVWSGIKILNVLTLLSPIIYLYTLLREYREKSVARIVLPFN